MGFDISRRVYLTFEEGTILHGAAVTLRGELPIRQFLEIQRASAALRDADEGSDDEEALVGLYRTFGDNVLLEWDLTDGETPVPANGEGMLLLPMRAANAILNGWNAAVGVSPNSSAVSVNGASAEAALVATAA